MRYIVERWVPKPGHSCASTWLVISVTNLTPMYKPNARLKSAPDGPTCQYHRHPRRLIPRRLPQLLHLWRSNKAPALCRQRITDIFSKVRHSVLPEPAEFSQHLHICLTRSFFNIMAPLTFRLHDWLAKVLLAASGVPRNFVRGGGVGFNEFSWGQRERGSGGGSPLVRGSGGSCNLVQEISFHIVTFS